MIRFGEPPYLECSSKGDRRFSAFFARIRARGNRAIEDIYQGWKRFPDGRTGLHWRTAKARTDCVNMAECRALYSVLWREYIAENPDLKLILRQASGLSDIFGQPGHACQAEELWHIREEMMKSDEQKQDEVAERLRKMQGMGLVEPVLSLHEALRLAVSQIRFLAKGSSWTPGEDWERIQATLAQADLQTQNAAEAKRRVEEHFTNTPPEQVVVQTESILRQMEQFTGEKATRECAHVPARPDADLCPCWKCGIEVVADVETHLFRPLTENEKLVKRRFVQPLFEALLRYGQHYSGCISSSETTCTCGLQTMLWAAQKMAQGAASIEYRENPFRRWVIVNSEFPFLAWSGSQWVPQRDGFPYPIHGKTQICNFTSREEAEAYAEENIAKA